MLDCPPGEDHGGSRCILRGRANGPASELVASSDGLRGTNAATLEVRLERGRCMRDNGEMTFPLTIHPSGTSETEVGTRWD